VRNSAVSSLQYQRRKRWAWAYLDFLTVAHREATDGTPKIDREAQPLGEVFHAAGKLGGADEPRQVVEKQRDILPNGESRDQAEVLEHHTDAEPSGGARRGDRYRPARNLELARIGTVIAVKNLAERAFASAILAEQRHDLAGVDRESINVIGNQRAEALDDPCCFKERHGPGHPPFRCFLAAKRDWHPGQGRLGLERNQ